MPDLSELEIDTLQGQVLADLQAWGDTLGPTLRAAWKATWARLRLDDGPGYFRHPLALPVIELAAWVAAANRSAVEIGSAEVRTAAGSGAAGYLHVRLQDDLLDEGVGGGAGKEGLAATLMLSEALLARHHSLAWRVAGDSQVYGSLSEQVWLSYAEAMALEAQVSDERRPVHADCFTALLHRSDPLVLPGACVMARTAPEQLPVLVKLVGKLSRSHQLFTDAIDAEKDLRQGNPSHILTRFAPAGDPVALQQRLFLQGGLDEIADEANGLLNDAQELASSLALPAESWLRRRHLTTEKVRRQAFSALFSQLL